MSWLAFAGKCLFSCNYGKKSSQIPQSKAGEEETYDEESRLAQEGQEPC
jgi:hypothetical protein